MQSDRKDKSAHGWEHHEKVDKHESQKGGFTWSLLYFVLFIILHISYNFCPDYKTGFGGDFGIQSDRVDKSAVGWEHHEQIDKHESQKGKFFFAFLHSIKFNLLNVLLLDYKTGFGGQYGVQADRVDKSAVGWDHKEQVNRIIQSICHFIIRSVPDQCS